MKINKTILLACLLVSGLANSQEFYTCVPKKDWWKNMIKEQKKEEWKLVDRVNVIRRKKGDQDVIKSNIPIGNIKIKLVKGDELIGEHILKNGNESVITIYDMICDCGKTDKCNYLYTSFSFDNMITLNSYFSKDKYKDIFNKNCEGVGGPVNSFVITLNNQNLLFGAMLWQETDIFDKFFKGTTLEIYKKVED